jgi:hypothetical protein
VYNEQGECGRKLEEDDDVYVALTWKVVTDIQLELAAATPGIAGYTKGLFFPGDLSHRIIRGVIHIY